MPTPDEERNRRIELYNYGYLEGSRGETRREELSWNASYVNGFNAGKSEMPMGVIPFRDSTLDILKNLKI